jgi:ubiquinone/menaquinone biosynthesis C-methylase UbiE
MAHHVCPWWIGYLLASPLRRLWQDPARILGPLVAPGMTVLEPGCGMGFFTLAMARLVGPQGRVVAVDIQPKMLAGLQRRARRTGLLDRVELRLAGGEGLGVEDLEGRVDFVLAFAMIHELPENHPFFADAYRALRPGGRLLAAEPRGHVSEDGFASTLARATRAGFRVVPGPAVRSSHTAILERA